MTGDARAKAAPRAPRTSDVARGRLFAIVALGGALGVAATLALGGPELGGRPVSRPHVVAKVACERCHDDARERDRAAGAPAFAAQGACVSCHAGHASRKPAHRTLAARGELACASCHAPHEGAQGVTFGDGGAVRWGAGPGVVASDVRAPEVPRGSTVPLVALAACARCHDPARASDPVARCVPAATRAALAGPSRAALLRTTPALCFDEHRSPDARFVAWDAAREVASATPWISPRGRSSPWAPPLVGLGSASLFGAGAALLERRRRRRRAAAPAPAPAPPKTRRLPVIDPTSCLGCYACVDACPFDVLAVERYVAVVARPDECCGVVVCEQVCPNGSLSIEEGAPVQDSPEVDEHLESADVPGIFVAGDLTGLPLIKNAINQGVRAVDRIASTSPRRSRLPRRAKGLDSATEAADVVVIGAGPAGLSAALRAKEKDLSCVVLEQATVAASIKSFPRDKVVHDPPLDLPVEGELWLKEASKEELVAQWARIVRARALDVREGRRVIRIDKRPDGRFVVTSVGEGGEASVEAARVVVAIGKRGTPRTLDLSIEPGAETRVSYALADARSFAGKRVVIAGLGDSAMEAAVALARQPKTSVTIAYRGQGFSRGKARNIAEVKSLVARGRVRIVFGAVPVAVSRAAVTLGPPGSAAPPESAAGSRRSVPADALLVLLGGVPSWELLEGAGIRRPAAPERKIDLAPALEPAPGEIVAPPDA